MLSRAMYASALIDTLA